MSFLEDKNVKVNITRITGRKPRYQSWSVDAKAWIQEDGRRKFERDLSFNVLKEDGQFEPEEDGNPTIVRRMKEKYEDLLKEDRKFKEYFEQSLEDERDKVNEMENTEFEF